jgi:hypothetical protein
MGLLGFLRPDRERIDHLERRIDALDTANAERQVAFLAIAEQVQRHLARTVTIEQRMKGKDEAGADPVTRAVLSMKFPPKQGGT